MLATMLVAEKAVRAHRKIDHVSAREHGIALVVAVLYVIVALADGGYPAEFRAGTAIVLWWSIILGIVLGLWPRAAVPRPALLAGMCLTGLAALTALSLTWASDDGRAFTEIVRVLSYLGVFVAVVLASRPGGARPWLVGLALGIGAVVLLALGSRLEPGVFPQGDLTSTLLAARARLSYPVGYWNALGVITAVGLVLFAWLSSAGATRAGRAVATAAIPASSLVLFLTSSRGAILALVVGFVTLLALSRQRSALVLATALGGAGAVLLLVTASQSPELLDGLDGTARTRQGHLLAGATLVVTALVGLVRAGLDRRVGSLRFSWSPPAGSRKLAIGGAVIVVIAALFVASPLDRVESFTEPPPGERVDVTSHFASGSSSGRYQYWETALRGLASAPVTGLGAGQYESWWAQQGTLPRFIRDAHSWFLETLAELGVAGLLLILAFVAAVVLSGARTGANAGVRPPTRAPALAVLAAGLMGASIDWMWEMPAAFAPVIIVAALLTGPALGPAVTRPASRFGVGVATLLVGWVAILASASTLAMEVKLDDSRDAFDRGDVPAAIEDAEEASSLQPWAAAPYLQQARLLLRSGDLDGAERAASEAVERAPEDWVPWVDRARILLAQGDVAEAVKASARVAELRPDARLERAERDR